DGAGRANWQFEGQNEGQGEEQGPAGGAAPSVALDEIDATGLRLSFENLAKGSTQTLDFETLSLATADDKTRLRAAGLLGQSHWTIEGETGALVALGRSDGWPFELRFASDQASGSAKGSLGSGVHGGELKAQVALRLESDAGLLGLGIALPSLPMPVDASVTIVRTREQMRLDPLRITIAGQSLGGSATLQGGSETARLDAALSAESLDLGAWLKAPTTPAAQAAGASARGPIFGDTPLPWPTLPPLPLGLSFKVASLRLPGVPTIDGFSARVASTPERLRIEPVAFGAFGGQVAGHFELVPGVGAPPRVELKLDASALSVDRLDAWRTGSRRFNGGRVDLQLQLALAGRTPRSLAASATGNVLFTARDVRLTGRSAALGRDLVSRVLEGLLPSSTPRENLLVPCAVARLPLRQGVAPIDRSIALETQQIAVSASGNIDLNRQTLELAFHPRVKRGLDLNPGSLVDLVLLTGPLENPALSLNPRGAVRQAANIGIAGATGGLSLLLPALRAGEGEATCAQAMRAAGSASKPTAAPARSGTLLPRPFASRGASR
ncbi:MAG TPA: AsmA-like C-terminal region-containing protein, partial [Variovorax sp.]